MKKAILVGASGLTGNELLQLLLQDETYSQIVALVRKPLPVQNIKLKQVVADFEHLENYTNEFVNTDDLFCCVGTTIKTAGSKEAFRKVDYDIPVAFANLCVKKNVKQFLCISAMGANANSKIFYNKIKGEMEKTISSMKIPSIIFFHPSLLLGDRKEKRAGEGTATVIMAALSFLFIGPLKNYKAIHVKKVAAAMLNEAKKNSVGVKIVLSGAMQ